MTTLNQTATRCFLHACFWPAFLVSVLGGSGCIVLLAQPLTSTPKALWIAIFTAVAVALSVVCSRILFREEGRFFLYKIVLVAASSAASLYAGELALRWITPAWPANGLHSSHGRAGRRNWGRIVKMRGGTAFNSWGQRDHERRSEPTPGIERVVFIGDSFLEESTTTPLALATERRLRDFEVINLGVSATAPDEYYYRLKNIGLALKPRQVYFFIFEGNDYGENPTLPSWGGVYAVYPRDSVLSLAGLLSLNHLLTNKHRPVLRAWRHGHLHASEQKHALRFRQASDAEIVRMLLEMADPAARAALEDKLGKRDLTRLTNALRHPDHGLWRSHYLRLALHQAVEQPRRECDASVAFEWTRRARHLCHSSGVSFTLVVIPEGSQVDPALRAVWAPLADMRHALAYKREASERLKRLAQEAGIVCIDLFDVLDGVPRTYLNLDGHWSDRGVARVAESLARNIRHARRPADSR